MQTLQVVLGDEVAELVRRAAEKEARSVSSWLRLLVERELAAAPRDRDADREAFGQEVMERTARRAGTEDAGKMLVHTNLDALPCAHLRTVKRIARSSGLTMKECLDCGTMAPV